MEAMMAKIDPVSDFNPKLLVSIVVLIILGFCSFALVRYYYPNLGGANDRTVELFVASSLPYKLKVNFPEPVRPGQIYTLTMQLAPTTSTGDNISIKYSILEGSFEQVELSDTAIFTRTLSSKRPAEIDRVHFQVRRPAGLPKQIGFQFESQIVGESKFERDDIAVAVDQSPLPFLELIGFVGSIIVLLVNVFGKSLWDFVTKVSGN